MQSINKVLGKAIIREILCYLEPVTTCAKLVCKQWRELISATPLHNIDYYALLNVERESAITFANAVKTRSIPLLKWLRADGCPWNEMACGIAAECGYLDVLTWLHENGCPWDVWTPCFAMEHGHKDIIEYAVANHCDVTNRVMIMKYALLHSLDMAKFACSLGICAYADSSPVWAISSGKLETLQWVHTICRITEQYILKAAVALGTKEMIEWLIDVVGLKPIKEYYMLAVARQDLEIIQLLSKHVSTEGQQSYDFLISSSILTTIRQIRRTQSPREKTIGTFYRPDISREKRIGLSFIAL